MAAFVQSTCISVSSFTPQAKKTCLRREASPATRMSTASYPYSPVVDEFFAKDVTKQYIAKACPSGVPPIQCIEGSTADAPYELRTLKRQSQLRYRQLPTSVKVHNMYESRRNAIIACHGCSHEEDRVIRNPILANAMALGQAESERACNRYIESSGPAEDHMCRAVENIYMKAVNGSGVFSTACTDGQAKYEAYLSQVRGKATEFRAKQYSKSQKAAAAFAARRMAVARKHVCVYEDALYTKFPRLAGSMRPEFGYYSKFSFALSVSVPCIYGDLRACLMASDLDFVLMRFSAQLRLSRVLQVVRVPQPAVSQRMWATSPPSTLSTGRRLQSRCRSRQVSFGLHFH